MIFHSDDLLTTPTLTSLESLDEIQQFLELSDSFYGTDVSHVIKNGSGDFIWASGSTDLTIDTDKSVISLDKNFSGNINIFAKSTTVFLNEASSHSLNVVDGNSKLNLFVTPGHSQFHKLSGNVSQLSIFSTESLDQDISLIEDESSTLLTLGNTTLEIDLLVVSNLRILNPDGTIAMERITPPEKLETDASYADLSEFTDQNIGLFEQTSDLLTLPSAVIVERLHEQDIYPISEPLIFDSPSFAFRGNANQDQNSSNPNIQSEIDVNFNDLQTQINQENSLELIMQIGELSFDQVYQDEDPTTLVMDL